MNTVSIYEFSFSLRRTKYFTMAQFFWDSHKQVVLSKSDKSFKQSIDEPIVELVTAINDSVDYLTTSSCSGRIMLINEADIAKRKNGAQFIFVSHDRVDPTRSGALLSLCSGLTGNVFLKLEPLIIHIQCKTLELAISLLHKMKAESQFKHTSIVSAANRKFIVSIKAVVKLEIPVMFNNLLLVDSSLLTKYLEIANQRMSENFDAISKLTELISGGILTRSDDQAPISPDPLSMVPTLDHVAMSESIPVELASSTTLNVASDYTASFQVHDDVVRISTDGKTAVRCANGERIGIVPDTGCRPPIASAKTVHTCSMSPDQVLFAFVLSDESTECWILIRSIKRNRGIRFTWKRVTAAEALPVSVTSVDTVEIDRVLMVRFTSDHMGSYRQLSWQPSVPGGNTQ